jgi:hypothetical protein
MKRPPLTLPLMMALALLAGCSAKPVVTDITSSQSATLKGIPFRLSTDHEVLVYRLKDDEDEYTLVASSRQRLADTTRLYAMNYKGSTFATNSLKVVQNADNTLKSVQVTSTDSTPGTIDSLTSAVGSVKAAETAQKAAALAAAKAVVEADKAVRDAQKELDALASTTAPETRALYEKLLESAKQQAAVARAAAGG